MIYQFVSSPTRKNKSRPPHIVIDNKSQNKKQEQKQPLQPSQKLHLWIDQNIKYQGYSPVKKPKNDQKFARKPDHKQRKLYTPGQRIAMDLIKYAFQLPDTSHKLSHPNESKILPGQNLTQQLLWDQKILYNIKQSRFLENHPQTIQQQKRQFQQRKLKRKQLQEDRVEKLKKQAQMRKSMYIQQKQQNSEQLKMGLQKINSFAWNKKQVKYDLDKYKSVKTERSIEKDISNNHSQNEQQNQNKQVQKVKINHQEHLNKIENALWKGEKSPKNYDYSQYVKQVPLQIKQIKIKKINLKNESIVEKLEQKTLPNEATLWGNKNQNQNQKKINYDNYRSQIVTETKVQKKPNLKYVEPNSPIEQKSKQKKQVNDQIMWGNKQKTQSVKNYEKYYHKKDIQQKQIEENKNMKKSFKSDQNTKLLVQPPQKQVLWQKKYLQKPQEINISSYRRKSMQRNQMIENQNIASKSNQYQKQNQKQNKSNSKIQINEKQKEITLLDGQIKDQQLMWGNKIKKNFNNQQDQNLKFNKYRANNIESNNKEQQQLRKIQIKNKFQKDQIKLSQQKNQGLNKVKNIIWQTTSKNNKKNKNIHKKESYSSYIYHKTQESQQNNNAQVFSPSIQKYQINEDNINKKNHNRNKTQQKKDLDNNSSKKNQSTKIDNSIALQQEIQSLQIKSKQQSTLLIQKSDLLLNRNKQQVLLQSKLSNKTQKKVIVEEMILNKENIKLQVKRSNLIISLMSKLYKNKVFQGFQKINENKKIVQKKSNILVKLLVHSIANIIKNSMKKVQRQAFIKMKREKIIQEVKSKKLTLTKIEKTQKITKEVLCFMLSKLARDKQAQIFEKIKSLKSAQSFKAKGIQMFSFLFRRKVRQPFQIIKKTPLKIQKIKNLKLNRLLSIATSFVHRKKKFTLDKMLQCNLNPPLSCKFFLKKKQSNALSLSILNSQKASKRPSIEEATQDSSKIIINQQRQELKIKQIQGAIQKKKNQFFQKSTDLQQNLSLLRKINQKYENEIRQQTQRNQRLKIKNNSMKQLLKAKNKVYEDVSQSKQKLQQLSKIYLNLQKQNHSSMQQQVNIQNFIQNYKLQQNLQENKKFFDQQQKFQLNCKLRLKVSKIQDSKNQQILNNELININQKVSKVLKGYIIQSYAWQNIKRKMNQIY